MFSRFYGADQRICYFSAAYDYLYINSGKISDSHKQDYLHLTNKGISVLATNLTTHLSTLADWFSRDKGAY